jgi:hypothetical protein
MTLLLPRIELLDLMICDKEWRFQAHRVRPKNLIPIISSYSNLTQHHWLPRQILGRWLGYNPFVQLWHNPLTMRWGPYMWAPPHCEWGLYQSCDGVVYLSFSQILLVWTPPPFFCFLRRHPNISLNYYVSITEYFWDKNVVSSTLTYIPKQFLKKHTTKMGINANQLCGWPKLQIARCSIKNNSEVLEIGQKSNTISHSCVSQKMMWLLKSPLSLWLIIIKFWSNGDFKNHIILRQTQEYF